MEGIARAVRRRFPGLTGEQNVTTAEAAYAYVTAEAGEVRHAHAD